MLFEDRPTIGILTREIPGLYFYTLLKGIQRVCSRRNINLRILVGGHFEESFLKSKQVPLNMACKENVDGVIVLSTPMPIFFDLKKLKKFISQFALLPIVNVGMAVEGFPSLIIENLKGIYDITSHLIECHGLKKIAYIGGPEHNVEAVQRFEGYKQALADHDIPVNPDLYFEGIFIKRSGIEGAREFFETRKQDIEAVVCANDETAMGVFEYCLQKGIKIPGDLAVTGFDNLLTSSYTVSPLTTVAQPLYKLGTGAVELMCDLFEKKSVPRVTRLSTALLIRRSCGCSFVDEINHGICELSLENPALSPEENDIITGILEKLIKVTMETGFIESQEKIEHIGTYIVSVITGQNDLTGPNFEEQPSKIENMIYQADLNEYELNCWQDFLAAFYSELKSSGVFRKIKSQVHNLFSTLIFHIKQAIRFKMSGKKSELLENSIGFRRLVYQLNLYLVLPDFLKEVTRELAGHVFDYFYLSLWDDKKIGYFENESIPETLRLMTGYDGKKNINGYEQKIIYKREELLPKRFFDSEKPHTFIIFPLVQHGYNFGTLLVKYQENKMEFYNPLWRQLCASLNLIRLFEEAAKKELVLQEMNVNLEHKVEKRTAALVEANKKLKEIDRLKTDFFANVSHELRTPLTLIMGPVEGIYSGDYGRTIECKNEVFKSILDNSNRLLRLINSLLDFAKIEEGKMGVSKKKTDIYKLLHYYLSIIRSAAGRRGIEVALENRGGELKAMVDRELLENALFNLFSNALKFTPRGGKITIGLDREENYFSISVKDTGIGIPEDKLDTIFERFTQVDEGAARKYEGTGIGLAFAREIVLLHDGTISVISEHGKGTEFLINLPFGDPGLPGTEENAEADEDFFEVKDYLLSDVSKNVVSPGKTGDEERAAPSGQAIRDESGPENKKKILVIDDNEDMRIFLLSILEKKYRVILAENGNSGLEKAVFHMPHLIVSDVMMPGMSGIELCNLLKDNDNLKHIPLILLTARTDMSLKIDGLKGKADDFLSKPFNSRELLIRIENLLENRELHVELAKKQHTIMTSVNYAANIQHSILPKQKEMAGSMKDFFVFWRPRDIVGGDIYWFKKVGNNFLLALIDCTGHGIPGAFMTMTAHAEINSIVKYVCNDDPAFILKELNNSIKTALNQEKEEIFSEMEDVSDDGLDIGLCYVNKDEQKITYAGARCPLYYTENKKLVEVQPDSVSIGYRQVDFNTSFINHEITLTKDRAFYLSSDGYSDQLGGHNGISFGKKRLKELLLRIHREEMATQKTILEKQLQEYQGEWDSVDDITIIGFTL